MKITKPALERINPTFGSSISLKQYDDPCRNELPSWHFHPELELVYVNGGSGKRHIGSHLSYFNDGELIFIGANLPHFGFTDRLTSNQSETIVQMREDFLGEHFFSIPEMALIKVLFEKAKLGLTFHGKTKRKVGRKMEKLSKYDPYDRLLKLLSILRDLAVSEEYVILNVDGIVLETHLQDNDRINVIFNFVRDNFKRTIPLEEISETVSMTVPAFCRYFKKSSGKTFTQFVNEYRLVHASKLLAEEPTSITDICFKSGFNNFSHFNKQFKQFTGKSPSVYRKELKQLVK